MTLSFQAVTLDAVSTDREATLVFRDGRLFAVLTCLSDIHEDLRGHWFIEVIFGEVPRWQPPPAFESLARFEEWLAGRD